MMLGDTVPDWAIVTRAPNGMPPVLVVRVASDGSVMASGRWPECLSWADAQPPDVRRAVRRLARKVSYFAHAMQFGRWLRRKDVDMGPVVEFALKSGLGVLVYAPERVPVTFREWNPFAEHMDDLSDALKGGADE